MEKYLSKFKKKHGFTDEDCKKYKKQDIIFDIDIDMPEDALEQWEEYNEKNGYISFAQWTGIDNKYMPKNLENDGMDGLKKELNTIYRNFEVTLNEIFSPFLNNDDDVDSDIDSDIDFDLNE